ncbi:hypothetical protein PspLS_02672 [Pyricularia sp. CBS 133598]|nr:hypothetical protein PspLS_02672 [Pyricularia sp. CBS 133598]
MSAYIKTIGASAIAAAAAAIVTSYDLLDGALIQKFLTPYLVSVGALIVHSTQNRKPAPFACASAIISTGVSGLVRSPVSSSSLNHRPASSPRTSRSAPLDDAHPAVRVRPTPGRGPRRLYNRVATFFAVLECDGCPDEGGAGETWFSRIEAPAQSDRSVGKNKDEDNGLGRRTGGNIQMAVLLSDLCQAMLSSGSTCTQTARVMRGPCTWVFWWLKALSRLP